MEQITIIKNETCSVRIELGIQRITEALQHAGYAVAEEKMPENFEDYRNIPGKKLYAGVRKQDRFLQWLEENEILIFHTKEPEEEGFYIESCPARLTVISGGSGDGSPVRLYGTEGESGTDGGDAGRDHLWRCAGIQTARSGCWPSEDKSGGSPPDL